MTDKEFAAWRKRRRWRYCRRNLPKTLAKRTVIVHNHVVPVASLGLNGFRAWTMTYGNDLVQCRCDFGGVPNAELHKHYRMRG
jgi:hypothetical protein